MPPETPSPSSDNLRTLAIDIGGTGIKMIVLDADAKPVNERARTLTPKPATPEALLAVIKLMVVEQP
ncbi:MAG TPA: ROK family protein, partial [Polyangiaceae bacterium]|nr:ROK family protein [Polyangiaceae bacterium]